MKVRCLEKEEFVRQSELYALVSLGLEGKYSMTMNLRDVLTDEKH